jgi:hypothetical protein
LPSTRTAHSATDANSRVTQSRSAGNNTSNKNQGRKRGKRKGKIRRKKKKKPSDTVQDIVLAHFNAQAFGPKEEIVKMEMDKEEVTFGSFCETCVYKNGGFSDKEWAWNSGPEVQPGPEQARASRGMGTLTKRGCKSATIHVSDNLMATRLEMGRGDLPIYVVGCHFTHSTDAGGHKELWDRISALVHEYEEFGNVVLMGDFNSHTKANGDTTEDTAGRRLMKRTRKMGLQVVNHMAVCEGTYSRIMHLHDGTKTATTIDYVCVSKGLVGRIKNMKLGQMLGSDHRFVTLCLTGMQPEREDRKGMREVWKSENLPVSKDDTSSFVDTFQRTMDNWIGQTKTRVHAMEAVGTEARRIADIVEWSFQVAMDQASYTALGTKRVGPRATPLLNSAMRMLNDHRKVCEDILKKVISSGNSTSDDRAQAVRLYRASKQALFKATARRKTELEQQAFRQIEEKQADSKLFWARAKRVTGRMQTGISPPPMAMNSEGKVESDPVEVLKIWRRFSAEMADMTPEEEGIYDEEYKAEVEARLDRLRRLDIFQEEMDGFITDKEVFSAIRRMKMGKAPGVTAS